MFLELLIHPEPPLSLSKSGHDDLHRLFLVKPGQQEANGLLKHFEKAHEFQF